MHAKMPSGLGGSYRSLADDVYKSTTVAENKFNMIESVKKAFSFVAPGNGRSDPLIVRDDGRPEPTIIPAISSIMPLAFCSAETPSPSYPSRIPLLVLLATEISFHKMVMV
ncbi:Tol-Pal system protein TolB [Frankliniella fusca]|uniref:Tol-Pal system protein TolB n=1 Tax=Frankliniella fusca TaxID=407009 RepID=A0AAE1LJ43_9NEOP|nr:Tol-Pal system protein TolB [Frankliniella fusca]